MTRYAPHLTSSVWGISVYGMRKFAITTYQEWFYCHLMIGEYIYFEAGFRTYKSAEDFGKLWMEAIA